MNPHRLAISPVIASIILIAVTIAIGVAIAGFTFGIFGTYSSTPNIKLESASLHTNGTLALTFNNVGPASMSVKSITAGVLTATLTGTTSIPPNSAGIIHANVTPLTSILAGRSYSFQLTMGDGSPFTVVTTAV